MKAWSRQPFTSILPVCGGAAGGFEEVLGISLPVDAGDVDDHIDHVAAQLIGGHVHWTAVCGDVNLAEHVEQEGLLDAGILRAQTLLIIGVFVKNQLHELMMSFREAIMSILFVSRRQNCTGPQLLFCSFMYGINGTQTSRKKCHLFKKIISIK